MYVYIQSEKAGYDKETQEYWGDLWTVGFYDPQGNWQLESDHSIREEAAKRVAWLNGRKE